MPETVLGPHVARVAAIDPDRPAVTGNGETWTYGDLWRITEDLARGLRARGVGPGGVVVVQMPPVREFVPSFLAVERLGSVVCPLLPSIDGAAFEQVAKRIEPAAAITVSDTGHRKPAASTMAASPWLDVIAVGDAPPGSTPWDSLLLGPDGLARLDPHPEPSGMAEIAFTSGTTATPKAVLHSHGTSGAGILATMRRQEVTETDVVHVALPVGHNFGYFYGVRLALFAGAHIVLQQRWDPREMLRLAAEHGVTVAAGPPTHLIDLFEIHEEWHGRLDRLRLYTCAGAKMAQELAARTTHELPGRLSRAFGMSEVGHTTSTDASSPADKWITTEGSVDDGVEMRVLGPDGASLKVGEVGEIAFRGPFLFHGYLDEVDTEAALDGEGFFRTGDLGFRDADGYMILTGRTKNVVIRGGENIAAEMVEQACRSHPAVAEVVVVAAPDPRLGERVVVCVQQYPGMDLTLMDLVDHIAATGLPSIYRPEAMVTMSEIPRLETGKIARSLLCSLVAEHVVMGQTVEYASMTASEENTDG